MIIDAYAHVGVPRFGTAAQAAGFFAARGVERFCLVLFPGCPDLAAVDEAHALLGERVRVFGMPYGRDEHEVLDVVSAQLEAGAAGFRFDPRELDAFPAALESIGRAGRIVYATNPGRSPRACAILADWLDRHVDGLVAAPHFLNIDLPAKRGPGRADLDRLVSHPRFAAILSRQGGMGSRRPYPHDDYRPWLEYLLEFCGWDRLMWGSEYPVLLWRNERLEDCRDWLERVLPNELDGTAGAARRRAYLGENAKRMIFGRPMPPRCAVRRPAWMAGRFNPAGPVTIFTNGFELPMTVYKKHLDAYLERLVEEPGLTFGAFVAEFLDKAE